VEEAQIQRLVTIGIMVVAGLIGIALVSGGAATTDASTASSDRLTAVAAGDPAPEADTTTASTATSPSGPAPTTTTAPAATTTTTVDPGALPQTDERPQASGPTFAAGVNGLWEAIRQDDPRPGLPFFFPESAYLQVKAISDPAGDYQNRLIANFGQDVHSLHTQLGANGADAKFLGITVPDDQAVWVKPGEESNKLSYWRVYGSTIQYELNGQTGSFPVTSLISWRGEWYVVHLGAIR
jgi:cytoskeletal protein RodZ